MPTVGCMSTRELARTGEDVAAAHLQARGLTIVARNWRHAEGDVRGEIDIVARDRDVVVFCEVKTRRGDAAGTPLEAITPDKQRRLRRLAAAWLAANGTRHEQVRFDAVAVSWPDGTAAPAIEHRAGDEVADVAARVGRAASMEVVGLDAIEVAVEACVTGGLPAFVVIGATGAAKNAADRVKTALAAVGVPLPQARVLVSLAPADLAKSGARYDLALAVAILRQLGDVPPGDEVLLGELALDGTVRPVAGVLPCASSLAGTGRRLVVAAANHAEAALVAGLHVTPVRTLPELAAVLGGAVPGRPAREPTTTKPPQLFPDPATAASRSPVAAPAGARPRMPAVQGAAPAERLPDLADVRGQQVARRALEIAAAGGHHLLLVGPPGCGKSMLARRLPGILPRLTPAQALELAAIRSVAGAFTNGPARLDDRPPFQAPHHSTSAVALLGGGPSVPRPGALPLAHRGVLFLDELFEWPRHVLEALREPLEEGVLRLARARAIVTYPSRALVVAAANPCPCGGGEACLCRPEDIRRYTARLSGPLADRFDLAPAVEAVSGEVLLREAEGECSAQVAARVTAARTAAAERWQRPLTNAEAPVAALRRTASAAAMAALARAVDAGLITARGFDRALRVARTIADLQGATTTEGDHANEALAHRFQLSTHAAS